jgi:hypothetical protein
VSAEPAAPANDFDLPGPLVVRRSSLQGRRRANRGLRLLAVLGGLLILLGGLALLFRASLGHLWHQVADLTSGPALVSTEANYRFRYPQFPWEQDGQLESAFGANLGMQRRDPSAWLAFLVIDYKDRTPREDELVRLAAARLKKYFNKGLEWRKEDDAPFAGRTAQYIVFRGERENVHVSGECYLLAHQGVAYGLFTWAPSSSDLDAAQQEWASIREGFTLLNERDGWVGRQPRVAAAEGTRAAYTLRYAEEIWERMEATGGADLVLLGRDPEDRKSPVKTATVTVTVQPAAADLEAAMKSARALAEAHQKEAYPDTRMEAVPTTDSTGLPEGPCTLGKAEAQVARFRALNAEDRTRFLAVAVVPRPEGTLVIQCECAWAHREGWEERFGPLLHSLRVEGK